MRTVYAYSPYGTSTTLGPDDGNTIQFTGRENDQTGLFYYRARYYDPVLKRFVSEDPIGLAGGANSQSYVHGNPVSFVDPMGLDVTITFFPSFPGHVGIGVNSSDTVGHYPLSKTGAAATALSGCRVSTPGVITRDRTRQSNSEYRKATTFVIPTTSTQDRKIQAYIDANMGKSMPWNTCTDQCTGFVISALMAGDIDVPDTSTVIPSTLIEELQRRYGARVRP